MGQAGAIAPVLTYLFHRLEARFTGRPTLLILDEAWVFLDHPLFAARIREWLKVLREECLGHLRDPEPGRYCAKHHRARHHRKLPAAHPAPQ
jgi:hypothetical protein